MPKPKRDRLLQRGVWLLVVGVFTFWILGLGLLFILAAAVCGFVGLFRERFLHSALLLFSSLVLGFICTAIVLHVAAIAGVFVFSSLKANRLPEPAPAPAAAPRHRK